MQHEQVIDLKTHKFILTIETTVKNPRAYIQGLREELDDSTYFEIKDVKVI